jgi:WD40 repeat protein
MGTLEQTLEQTHVLEGHTDRVWHVCWHPTRPLLASCGGDRTVRVWEPKTRERSAQWTCVAVVEDFTSRTVRSVAWSPCGRYLAAGAFDAKAYLWRVEEGSEPLSLLPIATLDGHENEVKSVAWAPSGSMLATSSRDKSVWVWEVSEGGRDVDMVAALTGHDADVKALAWHPRLDVLASASYDNSVRVWAEGEDDWVTVSSLPAAAPSTVWDVAWEPTTGSRLATVSDDGGLAVWDATPAPAGSSTVIGALTLSPAARVERAHSRTVYSVDWAANPAAEGEEGAASKSGGGVPAPPRIATAGADDCIRVWCAGAGGADGSLVLVEAAVVAGAHAGDVNCVRWQPPRQSVAWGAPWGSFVLASGGDDCLVRLWAFTESA